MRASRLVSLLMLLQTRGRMTAQQLADELEVSVRTIYRDVESLHAAGVPLYGDAGRDGGYQLLDGYRTRLTGLTSQEAESLFLAGLPAAASDLGLGTVAAAAQLKLMAALPEEHRGRAEWFSTRFHLDAPSWYQPAEEIPHLTAAADAVWTQRVLRARYRRWREPREVTRDLRPYGLVLKAGRWYLVAGHRKRVSTYRVSQILELTVLDERFDRPAGFDLADYWRSYLEDFRARRHRGEATIRVSARVLADLPDLLSGELGRAVAETVSPVDVAGWARAVIPIESVEHAARELLRLGTEVEVLAPAELREYLGRTVHALAAFYPNPTVTPSR